MGQSTVEREIVSSRLIDAPRERVFGAFSDPERLARWWGPAGFTNTFHQFEFRPGGRWRFTMHGPGGTDYENESVFQVIEAPELIVLRHLEPMHAFEMTMTHAAEGGRTRLTWRMVFDTAEECAAVRAYIPQANGENFDRLEAELRRAE